MSLVLGRNSYIIEPTFEYFSPIVNIGAFSGIADEVTFCGAMNHVTVTHPEAVANYPFTDQWKLDYFETSVSRGDISIGNDVWVGKKAFIMDGVTIGDGAIIGAMTVVAKDVEPYAVVVGNPQRVKRFRFKSKQIEKLLKIQWWLWNDQMIRDRIEDFKNIEIFISKYG